MSNKFISNIRAHHFTEQDKFLLDTNVWLHIYADKANPSPTTKIYSQAFEQMLQANSQLFINAIIFTEFVSNSVRLCNLKNTKKFKAFRNSENFIDVAKEVAKNAQAILQCCQRLNDDFLMMNTENLLSNFSQSHSDIKDQFILETCNKHQLTLVTDDSDFKKVNFKVLTANPNLLTG